MNMIKLFCMYNIIILFVDPFFHEKIMQVQIQSNMVIKKKCFIYLWISPNAEFKLMLKMI